MANTLEPNLSVALTVEHEPTDSAHAPLVPAHLDPTDPALCVNPVGLVQLLKIALWLAHSLAESGLRGCEAGSG